MAVVFDAEMERPEEFDAEFGGTFQRVTIPGKDGGHYTPVFEQVDEEHVRVSFVPSDETLPEVEETILELPQGPKGDNYKLTSDDKKEIAEMVEVGAITETDPSVPSWAKQPQKPPYSAEEVGAEPAGTADAKVSEHNTASDAHNDIRVLIEALTTRLNAFFDSDDTTLDELSEIVTYIKSNKTLIDSITTSKVNVSDIIDNLITNVANKPLSAAQGVVLKGLIDALSTAKLDANALADWAKQAKKPSYTASEVGALPSTTPIPSKPEDIGAASAAAVQQLSEEIVDQNSRIEQAVANEKGNIVQLLIDELHGMPVFGVIDGDMVVTLTTLLPNGVYELRFKDTDEATGAVGTMTITGGGVTYVNLLPDALTPDDITTVFDGKGYKNGYYASAAEPFYNTDANFFCTGLMVIPENRTFYIKGCTIDTALSHTRFGLKGEGNVKINTTTVSNWSGAITVTELESQYYSVVIDFSKGGIAITPYYFYFSASGTGEGIIVSHTPIE